MSNPLAESANPLQKQPLTQSECDDLARFLASLLQEHPELGEIVKAWPGVDAQVRAGVLALIRAVMRGEC